MAYGSFGASCFCRAIFDRSEQYLLIALSQSEKAALVSWQVWASGFLGHTYTEMGAYKKAVEFYDQTILLMENTRLLPSWTNQIKIARERARILMNDSQVTPEELKQYYAGIKIQAARGWAARQVGEILMHLNDPQAGPVDFWFEKAISEDRDKNLAFFLACDYDAYAKWFENRGDFNSAKDYTARAMEQFSTCGADGWREHAARRIDTYDAG